MKTLKYVLVLTLVLLGCLSCKDDPRNTEELVDPWLRERTPTALTLEGQVGEAVIKDNWRTPNAGEITVTLIPNAISDFSKVKVVDLALQYKAKASINEGGTIDLSKGATTIVITAENGEKRDYTLKYESFKEPIEGVYKGVKNCMMVYGGVGGVGDGGRLVWTLMVEKPWRWETNPKPSAEDDNTITLTLTDVNDTTGDTKGICVHDAGPDGLFAGFVYNRKENIPVDLKHFYRIIPEGTSTWEKKLSTGEIKFTGSDGKSRICSLRPTGTIDCGGGKNITIPGMAFDCLITEGINENWNYIWEDDGKFYYAPRRIFMQVVKQ